MSKLTFTKENGFCYERGGKEYILLEGKTLGVNRTSEIIFAMEIDEYGYRTIKTWFFCDDPKNPEMMLNICDTTYAFDYPTDAEKLKDAKEIINQLRSENDGLKVLLKALTGIDVDEVEDEKF